MPRPPHAGPAVEAMPGAVYAPSGSEGDSAAACPLNVGDTWMDPFVGGRMEDLRQVDHPGMNRYSATHGLPELVDAIVEKVRVRNGLACERESVLVSAGATGALAAAVGIQKCHIFVFGGNEDGKVFWRALDFEGRDDIGLFSRVILAPGLGDG